MIRPIDEILSRLNGVRRCGKGWAARCPAHDDRRASLSISEGLDGRVLLHCHAGCSLDMILSALNLEVKNLFPNINGTPRTVKRGDSANGKPDGGGQLFDLPDDAIWAIRQQQRLGRKPDCIWEYKDSDGRPVGFVIRWDLQSGKIIRPISRRGAKWVIGAMEPPRPLYNLPKLAAAKLVLVVEGEKCADAAASLGFITTTSAGGASAAHLSDWSPLAGREVWVFPDNDEAGRQYAETVANILAKLRPPARVKIVELPGLPEGGDIADWLQEHDAIETEGLCQRLEALAQAAEPWGDAEPETNPPPSYKPFPVEALPEPIRSFVTAGAEALGCDPVYIALPALVVAASAIGNARTLKLKRSWQVPAVLWGAIVGESGTLKSPALNLVLKSVYQLQSQAFARHADNVRQYAEDYERWQQAQAAWKKAGAQGEPPKKPEEPKCQRIVTSDTTVEALAAILMDNCRGILLARDELSGWVNSFNRYAKNGKGGDESHWLAMYNASTLIVDRKTVIPKNIHIPRAAVSIIGGIQPKILRRCLTPEHRDSGLAARLLFAFPPRLPKRWRESDLEPEVEERFEIVLKRLYDLEMDTDKNGHPQPKIVHLSPEAKAIWVRFFETHAVELAKQEDDLAAAYAKIEEIPARLALVFHHVRWANGEALSPWHIDAQSFQAAIEVAEWFRNEVDRLYQLFEETPDDERLRKLADWIAARGGTATVREVQMGVKSLRSPGAAEAALNELVERGFGTWEAHQPGRGRPARRFQLKRFASTKTPVNKNGSVNETVRDVKLRDPNTCDEERPFLLTVDRSTVSQTPPSQAASDKGEAEVHIEGDSMIF